MLFNSTDTRPLDTCQRGQPCPDQGFCEVSYRDWRNNKPSTFSSLCSNSTNQPMLHWSQILSVETTLDELTYTCNKPSCASRTLTDDIVQIIERQYILPVNVTIPPTTTTTQTSTTSLTSRTTTTVVTSATTTEEKSAATLVYMNYTKTIIFTFIFLIVACLFQFNYIN
ncbi:unnamed protein product [Rotaria sp. Silwood2]|nr:unnamed protein product [Rotaria sp. Silwood2]